MLAKAVLLICLSRFGSQCEVIVQIPAPSMEKCEEMMEWALDYNIYVKQITCTEDEEEDGKVEPL